MMSDSEQLWPAAPPRDHFLLLRQLLYIFIHICAPDGNNYIRTWRFFGREKNQASIPFFPDINYQGDNSVRTTCSKMLHFASVLWFFSVGLCRGREKKEVLQKSVQSAELSLRWCWIDNCIHHCLPFIPQGCGNLYFYPDLISYTLLSHCDP